MDLSNPTNLLIASIYYVLTGLLAFFSLFAVYILIRYGKSVPLAFALAIVYSFFFLTILLQSYQTLHSLLA